MRPSLKKRCWNVREKSETMPEPAVFLTCLMKKSPWIRDTRPKLVYLKTWSINHIIFRTTWNGKKKKQWKSMTKTHQCTSGEATTPQIFPKVTTCSAPAVTPFIATRINWAGMRFIRRITTTIALEMSCVQKPAPEIEEGKQWSGAAWQGWTSHCSFSWYWFW